MKYNLYILLLVLLSVSIHTNTLYAYSHSIASGPLPNDTVTASVDSIMKQVIITAGRYSNAISHYQAEIYTKGRAEIRKENILLRLGHHLFPVDRKNKDMIFEMVSESEYNAPNMYTHKFEALNGNSIPNPKKQQEAFTFLNINIYASTVYDEKIITPLTKSAFNYYEYSLINTVDSAGVKLYQIRFTPKQWSQKLISGEMFVREADWTLDKLDAHGRFFFAAFHLSMRFSRDPHQFILPDKANLTLTYNLLGNTVVSNYHSSYNYKQIAWIDKEDKQQQSLNLTQYYSVATDSIPIIRDTTYWEEKRDIPLTEEEKQVYILPHNKTYNLSSDTTERVDYLELTEQLTSSMNWNKTSVRVKYSGILNPFQLGYSARNGITYKQKVRVSKTFTHDRQLRFGPEVGYVFKRKEFFFKIPLEWEYYPEKMGAVRLMVANDNQTYSSEIMKDINEQLKDSLFTFDDLNLKYFRHYYVDLQNKIELFNGFQLSTSLSFHHRTPAKKITAIEPGRDFEDIINEDFNDFIPSVGISYTPRQYYWMDGHRKEYAYSHYPTFSVEIARGIPGILGSLGNYTRIEGDIQQSINIGLLRLINYHISAGMYTRKKSTYFADFKYFARSNFPDTWDDRIGGVFSLLKREWYNASDKYVQAHFMYQSPFILSKLLKKEAFRYVLSERFYVSQLWTPVLPNYTELGYGFGNHIFNVAAFVSFNKYEYQGAGFKFAFELFQ